MAFLSLLCLAVAASALPTPNSSPNVIFTGPNGVTVNKNEVEFTFTPQETEFKAKPENGFFIPKAPQLSPLYLFTFDKLNPKSPKSEGDKKENEEDKKPDEEKDTKQTFELERIDIFTDILEPITSLVFNGLSELLGILFSSDNEEEKRSYYMVMAR